MSTTETYLWLTSSLFILGVLLVPLGLSFLFLPEKMSRFGERLNNWISTEHFFDSLNKPRYQEKLVYRYHFVFGAFIIVASIISIYMLYFYTDIEPLMQKIALMAETSFGKWLLESLYYILLAANALAFVIGMIIFIRPSLLKAIEEKANSWVETEEKLKVLDKTKELPDTVLPGNPRIFGTLILIGAIYIIINTKHVLM
ncbi:MAG: hypothetical protein ACPHLK_00830 [Gammaproteobacteria bacterium]|jgi:hypothetical protein